MRLLRLFALQGWVIFALLMREIHARYGRENIGFLWMIGEPALFCFGMAIMWTAIRPAHEHGVPVTAFVITGYVPLTMWRHCVGRSVRAFGNNGSLLFHRQVTPLDIILARNVLEIYGSIIAGNPKLIARIYGLDHGWTRVSSMTSPNSATNCPSRSKPTPPACAPASPSP